MFHNAETKPPVKQRVFTNLGAGCGLLLALLVALSSPAWYPLLALYNFLSPDFEESLIKGYKRPVIGLKLCWRCKALKYRLWEKTRHHPNYSRLRSSAASGCWLCQAIDYQWGVALQDHNQPPVLTDPSELRMGKTPHLLLWFVDHTITASGYLDDLRGSDYYQYIYGPQPRALQEDPSSRPTFDLIDGWLSLCNRSHHCYQGEHSFPTRVVDVSGSSPRLVIGDGIDAPYITLSHCWGNVQPLITTRETLDDRLEEITFQSLPELFQDAVFITRQLGIRYLWIDSLCIVQDCEDDWAREASKMGNVYRHAYLTIFALDAPNSHHRILSCRPRAAEKDISVEEVELLAVGDKHAIFKQSPLCHRAWALQERLLSPRVLFYSKTEIFWECLACTAREGSKRIKAYRPSEYSYTSYECPDVKNCLIIPRGDSPSMPLSPPSDWYIIVVEYTRCYLTKPTDKLPALSGLAAIFQANTGYSYMAGLWQEDFRDGLLWYVDYTQNQVRHTGTENPGPSWSWVSSCRPVLYVTVTGSRSSARYAPHRDPKLVGSISTQKKTSNPMGEVLYDSVTVEADFEILELLNDGLGISICDSTGTKVTLFLDDCNAVHQPGTQCLGLFLTTRDVHSPNYGRDNDVGSRFSGISWTYFLVIVQDPKRSGCWNRIGLARCSESRRLFLQDTERMAFELV
ncbi:HET-domain-containing protein [Mollisia scopiformis]|uniref:HET-domain-containing protein n=1 Tax=Mollisia scopiformis TaxID=149040 RepID=A0A194XXX3_MOLSC|nr:HET-domain-containing protein [Mollisia scopiformis]KUJ24682.1 HET-domain-containing protein [Mollisia scopiformis]